MSDTAVWISIAISAVAIVVAFWGYRKAGKAQERAADAQERAVDAQQMIAKIEKAREDDRRADRAKASVVAKLTKEDARKGHSYVLSILNQGPAQARNVRVKVDPQDASHPWAARVADLIPQIAPGDDRGIPLGSTGCPRRPLPITIVWEDNTGIPGTSSTTLDPQTATPV